MDFVIFKLFYYILRAENYSDKIGPISYLTFRVFPIHAVKACTGGVEVWLHSFLTSALCGVEWLTSRPSRFIPGERSPLPLE
jgi:hypothetical protein